MNTIQSIKLLITTISISLLFSGCASLSKQQCLNGDWRTIGYGDGVNGYQAGRINKHHKACSKASVTPDYKSWESGRQEGLKRYCTEENAFRLGKSGDDLNSVCPSGKSYKLEMINRKGKEIHQANADINTDRNKLKSHQAELDKLRNGDMLDFTSEREVRSYLISLNETMRDLERRITRNQNKVDRLNLQSY